MIDRTMEFEFSYPWWFPFFLAFGWWHPGLIGQP